MEYIPKLISLRTMMDYFITMTSCDKRRLSSLINYLSCENHKPPSELKLSLIICYFSYNTSRKVYTQYL